MAVRFACPECGQKLHIGPEFAGRLVACPTCSAKLRVPEPEPGEIEQEAVPLAESEPEPSEPEGRSEVTEFPWGPDDDDFPDVGRSSPPPIRLEPEPAAVAEQPADDERPWPTEDELPAETQTRPRPEPVAERPVAAFVERPPDPPMTKGHFNIDYEELIDMTAMVDIVFFLLIFFLVTSMQALDSTIAMPKPDPAQGAGAAASEPSTVDEFDADEDYIVVRIDKNDALDVEGVVLQGQADLLLKLRELRDAAPHPNKLLVVGDGEAHHGTLVMVLDTGHDAGMERVRMAVGGAVEDE